MTSEEEWTWKFSPRAATQFDGLETHVQPTTPPSTTYELTENGDAFVGLLEEMEGMIDLAECSDGSECATADESSKCATVQ